MALGKNMIFKSLLGLFSIPLALASGCAITSESQGSDLVEAYASNVNLAQKKQIESKISHWFGGLKITLADNVFSESSQVSIERKAHMDERRLPVEGRHSHSAFTFTLLTDGEHCILRNDQTDDVEQLTAVTCIVK